MMLKVMQENGLLDDALVCFANTGKESSETLDFIKECSERWNIPVTWLEFRAGTPKFQIVDYDTASRKGEPFEQLVRSRAGFLPNATMRFCTGDLKIKTIRRYVRSIGIKGQFDTYIGLRWDEPTRVARKKAQNAAGKESEVYFMPLYDMRLTISDRDAFWAKQGFNLGISSFSDNCDLCFMKGKAQLVNAIRKNPQSADWWIAMEERARLTAKKLRHGRFRKAYSYKELLDIAINQTSLPFAEETHQSITCSCTD